jgi:hypothetical protein
MSTETFEQETTLILDAVARYRAALADLPGPKQLAPYGHLALPNDNGFRVFLYRSMVEDHARHLANDVNRLCRDAEQLAAWNTVLGAHDAPDQLTLLGEFVEGLAVMSVALPYALRNRFHFSVAHLSHQANLLTCPGWKESQLPSDISVSRKTTIAAAQSWQAFPELLKRLDGLNDEGFVTATRDFRNKYNHRFPPRFVLGFTQTVSRMLKEPGRTSYGIGGVPPLELTDIVSALRLQCDVALDSFRCYSRLAEDQVSAIALLDKPL